MRLQELLDGVAVIPRQQLAGVLTAVAARLVADSETPPPALVEAPEVNIGIKEAAKRLGVSERYLYRNHKKLPFARRIGKRVVFAERGLDRWNRQQQSL